jgi:hypothetical protein
MSPATHESRAREGRSLIPPSVGGIAAILGGLLFVAWGYVHRDVAPWYFDATAQALSFVVPALFYTALTGLYALCRESVGRLGKFGFVLAFAGSAMGVAYAVPWSAFASRDDWRSSLVWLDTPLVWWLQVLLIGIPLVGIWGVRSGTLRGQGFLLLAIGAFGWVYYAADSGAILASRSVHVVFGALFGLGWIALGLLLLHTEPR